MGAALAATVFNWLGWFGIIGPLVGHVRPSWMFPLFVGLIGGSPTFLGTIIGRAYTSSVLETVFLALAAGSIIYVVQTLTYTGLRSGRWGVFSVGLLAGLVVGIGADLVIAAAGISSSPGPGVLEAVASVVAMA